MALLLSAILAVPAYVLWDSNQLASWLCIGSIAVILFVRSVIRTDEKARVRCSDYWAHGGPWR